MKYQKVKNIRGDGIHTGEISMDEIEIIIISSTDEEYSGNVQTRLVLDQCDIENIIEALRFAERMYQIKADFFNETLDKNLEELNER